MARPCSPGSDTIQTGPPVEVMTRAFQILFHRLPGNRRVDLNDPVRDDPEMPDLALGLLFHHDPA